MAKYEVLITAVTVQGLSYREVAARYGVSKSLVHTLHHRWLTEGESAFEQHSRRPRSSPNRTPELVRARVIVLRDELVADGLDAGADTITETLKKYLATRPATTIAELQQHLDTFRHHYNEVRPHRALNRKTPGAAYALIPKAAPTSPEDPDVWRVRNDTIDRDGKIIIRHSGRLLHLGIGRAHTRVEIIALIHNNHAIISTRDTGEILAEFTLDPTRGCQRKSDEPPKPGVHPVTMS
ncbi:MAG: hypothetical protein ABS63_00095 [Microbacterium sp. SCN 70-27]|uniref:integrase core domain-containing protein n=1 Tax=unclassified Microbacterium TaxID=2609290 RepID=UPI00086EB019|nr:MULTISPECIES: integrase core domain-containing protein [unclassified Microbacterium]MBN9224261.1 transposase [Microbacterium sp.]ODT29339.1 MAG: hypothetical protein ABS63_00095 [Microbacterium sp. SCN 70-27]